MRTANEVSREQGRSRPDDASTAGATDGSDEERSEARRVEPAEGFGSRPFVPRPNSRTTHKVHPLPRPIPNQFTAVPGRPTGYINHPYATGVQPPTVTEFVLYGGKGGVGKTTCAAATALKRAREDGSTLVVSTDPAHSLSDVFDAGVGAEPTRVLEDAPLWAVEVDPGERIGQYRGQVSAALEELEDLGISLDEGDVDDVLEAGVAPGTDEAAAMDLFLDYMDDPRFDYIVFDTAPTGHTLRLLKLPDVMSSAMGKLISVRSQVSSIADSVRSFMGGADGDDEGGAEDEPAVDVDLDELKARMERVAAALRDPERTEFRPVLIPETMAVLETERLLAELDAYDVPAGRAVINKVIEDPEPECDLCQARHASQQDRIVEARERFDLPITIVPQLHGEVHGLEAVERVAARL